MAFGFGGSTGFRYRFWVRGSQRVGVSKHSGKVSRGIQVKGLGGTCLHHEGPSSLWILDQLHLPRSKKHWSRHMLVPGAPWPQPQPLSSCFDQEILIQVPPPPGSLPNPQSGLGPLICLQCSPGSPLGEPYHIVSNFLSPHCTVSSSRAGALLAQSSAQCTDVIGALHMHGEGSVL